MILGALSDTHTDTANAIPHIMREFKKRGVEYIIHPGDIDPKHLKPEMFLNLPVACALTEEQVNGDDKEKFLVPPKGWIYTRPGNRIVRLPNGEVIYVGHKLSSNFLTGSEAEMDRKLQEIRNQHDGLRLVFSGHTHHGIRFQGHLVTFVNPGAVEESWDGHEFAIIDTDTGEIVFCRIPKTKLVKSDFSFAVISDSLDISEVDPTSGVSWT